MATRRHCDCEHWSHFDNPEHSPWPSGPRRSHAYGKPECSAAVRTECGTFFYCDACAEDHRPPGAFAVTKHTLFRTAHGEQIFRATGVDEYTGTVTCHPVGGGFQYTFPLRDVACRIEELPTVVEPALFAIEDGPAYPGYWVSVDRWNGWAKPLFTREVAEQILDGEDIESREAEGGFDYRFEDEQDDDWYHAAPELRQTVNGKHLTLYAIGDGWCWDKVDPQS